MIASCCNVFQTWGILTSKFPFQYIKTFAPKTFKNMMHAPGLLQFCLTLERYKPHVVKRNATVINDVKKLQEFTALFAQV